MDKKFKPGLANSVIGEFDNIRKIREEFIGSGASKSQVSKLRNIMDELLDMYCDLSDSSNE